MWNGPGVLVVRQMGETYRLDELVFCKQLGETFEVNALVCSVGVSTEDTCHWLLQCRFRSDY